MGKIIFGSLWMLLGIALIGGFINHNVLTALPPEPSLPQGLPSEISRMTVCSNEKALRVNDASAVIALGKEGTIQFDSISSLQGYCGGSNAILTITSPVNASLSATCTEPYWHGDIKDEYSKGTPTLQANFQSNEFLHQWVTGHAAMDAIYPVRKTPIISVYWTNEQKHVERNFNFYVVTPEEAKTLQAYADWKSEGVSRSDAIWIDTPIVFIVFVLFGALLVRYGYRKRKYESSSRTRWRR